MNKPNPLNSIWVVFKKEVGDNLRDRRSIISTMMSSLIGPAILLFLIIILGRSVFRDIQDNPLNLPVIGQENAPELIQFLEQNGTVIVPGPEDPETEVRNGNLDVVLVIPEGYAEDFSRGIPATIRLVVDTSRQTAMASVERARNLIETYSAQIGNMRLVARGVNPIVTSPLAVERVDVATPQTQALIFLNMMPYFIILVVFVGGMYVIIDTTAGERERGSLEPLLINPAPRWVFVIGKILASIPFAISTLFLTLLAFAVAFNVVPLEEYIGFQLQLDTGALVMIFLLSLPMILLAASLQMIIASFTRSFKEAQTYVSFLPLIPALPGMALAFLPVKPTLLAMAIPTFGQQIIINQLMRSEPVNPLNVIISTGVTLAVSLILIWLAVKLYERERVIFGTK